MIDMYTKYNDFLFKSFVPLFKTLRVQTDWADVALHNMYQTFSTFLALDTI